MRNSPRKAITVYLADGDHDLNNQHGRSETPTHCRQAWLSAAKHAERGLWLLRSWPIANKEMFSALSYAGYACHLEWGKGCHSGRHIMSVLPDAVRWLFNTPANPEGARL